MNETSKRIAEEFLLELVNNIKKESRNHYHALDKNIHILAKKEKVGYSIIYPALSSITNWIIMEQYVERCSLPGRVDFLINYKDYLIALECKTGHHDLSINIKDKKSPFNKINEALEQLNGLELIKFGFLKENTKDFIKIALINVVFCSTEKKEFNGTINYKQMPKMIKNKCDKEFKIIDYWKFDEDLKYPKHHHKDPNKSGTYDGVLFLAYIDK